MPIIQRENGQLIHFDITGHKNSKPIITTHGYIENGAYWSRTGVSAMLANEGYCVVDMDMRGHGKSFPGKTPDYSMAALVEDISAVADYMGFEKFHLLTHATGGIVGCNYAIAHSDRLLSMIASDTASCTIPVPTYAGEEWDDKPIPPVEGNFGEMNAAALKSYGSFANIMKTLKEDPVNHPLGVFFQGCLKNEDPERCFRWTEEIYDTNVLDYGVEFAIGFGFNDADRHVAELRKLRIPVLAMAGELDFALLDLTKAIARNIPGAKFHEFKGLGHMTAIEAPEETFQVINEFLKSL